MKERQRARCRARRRALRPERVAASSRSIVERLLGLESYARAGLVHTYVGSKENEVETRGFIGASLERGKRVAVPVVRPGGRMLHAQIRTLDQLRRGRWELYEPLPGHRDWLEDLGAIDLVVVPGLAFDAQGRRLGLGGGFYDRFLARVAAPKVGLCYQVLLLDQIAVEAHDVPVDMVLTEESIYIRQGGE